MEEKTILEKLQPFANIKTLFVKYNTPLPSSGSVERSFNYATILTKSKRNLNDVNFENVVFLKCNSSRF